MNVPKPERVVSDEEITRSIRETLRDSVAANKRRAAIRQRLREPNPSICDHSTWNNLYQWCEGCGLTKEEQAKL